MLLPLYLISKISGMYRVPLHSLQGSVNSVKNEICMSITPSPLQTGHLPFSELKEK